MFFPLRYKLTLGIGIPLLAVYSAVLVVDYRTSKAQSVRDMERHLTELTAHLATEIDRELSLNAQATRSAADFLNQSEKLILDTAKRLLASIVQSGPTALGAAAAFAPDKTDGRPDTAYLCRDATGKKLVESPIDYDCSRWDWYLLPKLLGKPAWTDPYFDAGGSNSLICTYAAPFQRDGRFGGVVTVDVALEGLQARMAHHGLDNGFCTLVSGSGTFVSHPNPEFIMAESVFSRAEWLGSAEMDAIGREMIAGKSGVRKLQNLEGVPSVWVVFTPVPSVGWSLAAAFPEQQLMAPVNERINRQAALLLCGLVGALAILMAIAFWFTRPIERLAAAAAKVAGGDLDARVEGVATRDEIGRFADTFNRMTADLKQSVEQRLREEAARKSIEAELHVARQIQSSLLPMIRPPFPDRAEFSLDAINEPAVIMAGDFFDFWLVDDDTLALVMADVSGKGVPAAMFMAVARTILRNSSEPGRGPAELLKQINDVIVGQNETEMFVTVVYAHYRISTGSLRFANGGHCLPIIVRASGSVEILGPTTGPLVGVLPDIDFDEALAALAPGDTLLLYTDGVTEAADATGRMLGEPGLTELLKRRRCVSPEDLCLTVLEAVNRYRSSPNQDDVTLLALKRNH